MKKTNLMVIHTQYNLILALGLCQTNFINDKNDLILFKDFDYNIHLDQNLTLFFENRLILEGNYRKHDLSVVQKMQKIFRDNRMIKTFITKPYDRVLIVDDVCIQEMYVLKCCKEMNSKVEMSWLEDGAIAYFSNGIVSGGMGATLFRRFIRKLLFSTIFSLGDCYDLPDVMGGHKLLKKIYVTFPENIREELRKKEKVFISNRAFELGISTLFKNKSIHLKENSLLIALDKLDVYGDALETVNKLLKIEIETAKKSNITVYYKYHPRETGVLPALKCCVELDRRIALEYYLANSTTRSITVIGIKSTSLQVAKKMGYKVKSLIRAVSYDGEEVAKFYAKIGIECE